MTGAEDVYKGLVINQVFYDQGFDSGIEKACEIIQQELCPAHIDLADFIRMRTKFINSIKDQI